MIQHWIQKFQNALRGIWIGSVGESSFAVHLLLAVAVLVLAATLGCEAWEWCLLIVCIALVMSMELMNSALEFLARGLCREENEAVGKALDIASGAVLCASFFAAIVGILILFPRLWQAVAM